MKKVLITGANSYIGTSFDNYVKENYAGELQVDTVDMIDGSWREKDFSGYDTVFHVAGLAHADVGNVSEEVKKKYYAINTDLTIETAKKAQAEGVGQFVFMSSIIVYGESAGIGKQRVITKDTPLTPANFYGDSKVKAEEGIRKLDDESFKVVILRPPMIYGKGSKGNYPLLAKMARKLPVFPDIRNERSMLYVGNLCEFICLIIKNEERGVFYPQNSEYVRTSDMVKAIAETHNKKVHLVKIFNPVLRLLGILGEKPSRLVNKAFGNMVYEKSLSKYKEMYRVYALCDSIYLTEV